MSSLAITAERWALRQSGDPSMALGEQLWGAVGGNLIGDGKTVEMQGSQVLQGIWL